MRCPMQTAVRLCLPGELAKHAVSEGTQVSTKCHPLFHNMLVKHCLMQPMACHNVLRASGRFAKKFAARPNTIANVKA